MGLYHVGAPYFFFSQNLKEFKFLALCEAYDQILQNRHTVPIILIKSFQPKVFDHDEIR